MEKEWNTIDIEHVYASPRERVFHAWLDPLQALKWYHAGGGWTTPHAEIDARVGGRFNIGFASPDGTEGFDFEGTFTEIIEPVKISYTIDDGRPVIIHFDEVNEGTKKTKLTLTLALEEIHTEEEQRKGWGEMLANLEKYLATLPT